MVKIPKQGEGGVREGIEYMRERPMIGRILGATWREHQPLWPIWLLFPIVAYLLLTGAIDISDMYVVFIIIFIIKAPLIIKRFWDYERAVVLRLGKFHRLEGPGWCIIWPIVEEFILVDLRLEEIIIKPQKVITKDKIKLNISLTVFMYVTNPRDAVLNVQDYKLAIIDFITATLTSVCGAQNSDYMITHGQRISREIEEGIAELASIKGKEWGVTVPRVEINSIEFPPEVQEAMHSRVAAEQQKLAAHEEAEASKAVIDAIREAGSKLTDPAITYLYLQALDRMSSGRDTKIFLPMEISKIAERITKSTTPTPDKGEERADDKLHDDHLLHERRIKSIEDTNRKDEYERKIRDIKKKINELERK